MVAQAVARKHHINGIRCRRTIPHVVRCCAWWLRLDRLPNSGGSSAAGERQGRPHRQFANRPSPDFQIKESSFLAFLPLVVAINKCTISFEDGPSSATSIVSMAYIPRHENSMYAFPSCIKWRQSSSEDSSVKARRECGGRKKGSASRPVH
jgi:hypothetical protein